MIFLVLNRKEAPDEKVDYNKSISVNRRGH